jgi:uncharacterized membrane protein (DUF2068 family)
MSRVWWWIAGITETLMTFSALSLASFAFWLSRLPDIHSFGNEAVLALRLTGIFLAAWALSSLVAAVALWKRRRWARWMAFTANLLMLVLMLFRPVTEHEAMSGDDTLMTVLITVGALLMLAPGVAGYVSARLAPPGTEPVRP